MLISNKPSQHRGWKGSHLPLRTKTVRERADSQIKSPKSTGKAS